MADDCCRFCGSHLTDVFCDLGTSPPSNSYLKPEQLESGEAFYPLLAFVCSKCFLVQLQQFQSPDEIFSDYAYFSSYSASWLRHAQEYAEYVVDRFGLGTSSQVVE